MSYSESEYTSIGSDVSDVEVQAGKCCGCFGTAEDANSTLDALKQTYEESAESLGQSQAGGSQPAESAESIKEALEEAVEEADTDAEVEVTVEKTTRRGFLCCGRKPSAEELTIEPTEEPDHIAEPNGAVGSGLAEAIETFNSEGEHQNEEVMEKKRFTIFACCKKAEVNDAEIAVTELVKDAEEGEHIEVQENHVRRSCLCCKRTIAETDEVVVSELTESPESVKPDVAQPNLQLPKYTAADVKAVVEAAQEELVDVEDIKRKEEEALQEFSNQEGGLGEVEKFENYTQRFPNETEETRRRWSTTIGCYLIFDPSTRQFEMVWSTKSLSRAIGFFSCPPEILPNNKLRLGERSNITEKGSHSAVARAGWLTFARYAARYDGEIVYLTNELWRTGGFGNVELIFLEHDGSLAMLRKGDKPYQILMPQAIAAVENSFRFQPKRRGSSPKWSLTSFATTTKSLSQALYAEINPRQRIRQTAMH